MKQHILYYIFISLFLVSCPKYSGDKVRKVSQEKQYVRSLCANYKILPLTKKQIELKGKASFSVITDYEQRIGFNNEFSKQVLIYFKKGVQAYQMLMNDEITDKVLLESAQKQNMDLVIMTELKIAKVFGVPIRNLPQGGWEIEQDYLIYINNVEIKKVFSNICEEQIISLLEKGKIK